MWLHAYNRVNKKKENQNQLKGNILIFFFFCAKILRFFSIFKGFIKREFVKTQPILNTSMVYHCIYAFYCSVFLMCVLLLLWFYWFGLCCCYCFVFYKTGWPCFYFVICKFNYISLDASLLSWDISFCYEHIFLG